MIAEKERLYNDQEFDVGEYEQWKLFPILYSAHLKVPVKSSVAFRGDVGSYRTISRHVSYRITFAVINSPRVWINWFRYLLTRTSPIHGLNVQRQAQLFFASASIYRCLGKSYSHVENSSKYKNKSITMKHFFRGAPQLFQQLRVLRNVEAFAEVAEN